MKTVTLMLIATLLGAAGAQAAERGNCPERGRCRVAPPAPIPPVPPSPPIAPLAPTAPLAPLALVAPEAPIPPMPPMPAMAPPPPPPPPMPAVPDAAHNACAGKAVGTTMTYRPRRGESMSGTCEKDGKGMYFELNEYRSVN